MIKKPTRLEVAREMPPLRHSIPGEPFRMENSEVVKWLIGQPEVLQYLFDKAKAYLVYDPETGTWKGSKA